MTKPLSPRTGSLQWFSLAPRWQSPVERIPAGSPVGDLATAFKLILLGDGSTTQNLQLVTGEAMAIDIISMIRGQQGPDGAPDFIGDIPQPRLRRQIWLRTTSGRRLAYAVSWWPANRADQFLQDGNTPIWTCLATSQTELYRDLRTVVFGDSAELAREFGSPGPFWGRYYFFRHGGRPLTLIHEIFNSALNDACK